MSNINIKRAVENIRSGTNIYTPLVELTVNAIQAIRSLKPTGGTVTITVLRGAQTESDRVPHVDGFTVADDGIGFTRDHREAFDTLYTEFKLSDGGKGFGRFTCLKYFREFLVKSVFKEKDIFRYRSFAMGRENNIIINEKIEATQRVDTGSVITVRGVMGLRGGRFPDKGIDVIARVLVEKILPYFIDQKSECPRIVVVDEITQEAVILNDYLSRSATEIVELPVENNAIILNANDEAEEFIVRVFKFYSPRSPRSKITLVAHRREVTDVTIQTYVPEFADEFFELAKNGDGARNFIIKAYVFGDYLDRNVSFERGAFNFQRDQDLIYGISQSQLERYASNVAREAVGQEVSDRRARKLGRIKEYIDNDAPWHRAIGEEADFSSLPMNPSPHDIELHLQAAKFDIERRARDDVRRILDDKSGDLDARVIDVVNSISQTSKNDLIHYVSLRKCVLDLLSKSLELDDSGKYKSEGSVHDIIMPRRTNSDTVGYQQHNLWILDERLNFAGYVSSELPFDGKTGDRADIIFYGNRIAFRGDNEPSNPIIIFEFKKPQRDDFVNPSSDEDPVQQIIRYVNDIRDGKYKTPGGREILVTDNTPFYGYVVCDLPRKTRRWLERDKNFTEMPDGLGYFQWYGNIRLYIEVLSWTKVHKDAKMRNRVFFHKLGINAPEN